MKLSIALAAITTAGLAVPAIAADTAQAPGGVIAAVGTQLSHDADARQAQRILLSQGYETVSTLDRAPNGHWVGTATKGGKTTFVAVNLPRPAAGQTN